MNHRINYYLAGILVLAINFAPILVSAEDCPQAMIKLNELLKSNAIPEKKEVSFQNIEKLCPNLPHLSYEYGKFFLEQKNYKYAIEKFKKANAKSSQLEYSIALGNSYLLLKDYGEAEKVFKDAIAKYDGHWSVLEGLGVLYYSLGRNKEAEDLFRQALQDPSSNPSVYYNLGLSLDSQARFDEAEVSYKTALDKNPKLVEPRLSLIQRNLFSGNYDEAKELGEEGLLYHPESNDLIKLHIETLGILDENQNAFELVERLSDDNGSKLKEVTTSVIEIKNGNDDGFEELKIIYKKNPEDHLIVKTYGWALLHFEEYNEAEKILKKAISLNPDDAVSLNNLGLVYEKLGKIDLAKNSFSKARGLLPYSNIVLVNQERIK